MLFLSEQNSRLEPAEIVPELPSGWFAPCNLEMPAWGSPFAQIAMKWATGPVNSVAKSYAISVAREGICL